MDADLVLEGGGVKGIGLVGAVSAPRGRLGTMASAHDRLLMDLPGVSDRTVFVDTMGVKATDFDLGPEVQTSLFEQGRAAAKGFLHGWNFDAYVARFYQRPETAA